MHIKFAKYFLNLGSPHEVKEKTNKNLIIITLVKLTSFHAKIHLRAQETERQTKSAHKTISALQFTL